MRNVYTVKQVNAYIKNMFTQDFMLNRIYIKGEVSNCKYHTSGHLYFSLKDESGTIACVMFAGQRSGLSFRMQEGQQVIVLGSVSVYERDGRYQVYAKEIVLDGAGLLYEKFIKLKKELEEICADSWCCNGTNRSGSARYYQHYQAEKSICADSSVSGTGTGGWRV